MRAFVDDVRKAMWFLTKNMAFTTVAVLCLGLGIGVSAAVFSATYAIALRQLPYPNPGALVEVRTSRAIPTAIDSKFISVSATDDLIAQAESLASVGRYMPVLVTLTGTGDPEQISGLLVTPEWFSVLGIDPIAGRRIQQLDVEEGRERIAVISHALWQRRFGGTKEVIGSEILMTAQPTNVLIPFSQPGRPYTVIGVMPERSRFPVEGDIWIPLNPERQKPTMGIDARSARNIGVLARLRSGTSISQANGELRLFGARAAQQYPDTDKAWEFRALLLRDAIVERYSTILYLMLGAVNLVMLLTCVCISGLLIARNRSRQKEVAIRTALGATRLALIRQFVSEGLVLSAFGGALGLVLSVWFIELVRAFAPPTIPRLEGLSVDSVAFAYTAVVALVAGVLVGAAPAIQLTTPQLGTAIKEHDSRNRRFDGYRPRLRGLLIGFEIALVVPVAIGAALMLRSVGNLLAVDVGYRTDHVLAATVRLSSSTCANSAACAHAYDEIVGRLQGLPNVESAALSSTRPFGNPLVLRITTEKVWDPRQGHFLIPEFHIVTPEYFRILGIPLLEGRVMTKADDARGIPIAVINTTLAKSLFGNQSAVGRSFSLAPSNRPGWIQVVGVVADTRNMALTKPPMPAFYLPLAQSKIVPRTVLLVRTTADPSVMAPLITAQIRAVDKNAPITAFETLDNIRAQQTSEPRFQASILMAFAGLGLVLAVVGIYGLISYTTSDRFKEFGIRLALGAKQSDIFRLVVGESMSTLGWGLTFGIGAAIGFSRLLRGQLYEVSVNDPFTFVLVPVLVIIAALIGYVLPARRATRTDPLVALRYD